ncbi:MAG: DUF6499 domain-containing protein [Syntrophobacteria bacterium]
MSRTQESQDQFLKYRWEFLRRNEDYQNDYKEVERVFHKNDCSLDHYWIASISVPTDICAKWDINHPVDPSRSYDEYYFEALSNKALDSLHGKLALTRDDPIHEVGALDFFRFKGLEPEAIEEELMKEFLETKKCMIEINLRHSKTKIIDAVKQHIDAKQSLLEQEGALEKDDKYSSKKRYDNYDYYLAVYDLRKQGTSWSKIQKAMDLNSIQTARDYYKAAKKLIDTGLSP